jgi:N-acyl-D-amino-acid deacylase
MHKLIQLFAAIALLLLGACHIEPKTNAPDYTRVYDLYIHGGTIIDGTGAPSFEGDILVNGDNIIYIGATDANKITAGQTINATGKIITPGFIDAHAHGNPLSDDNDYLRSFLRQGVTTVILGQDGSSINGAQGFSEWLDAVRAHGSGTNIATLVGHGSLRTISGGGEKSKVTTGEQANMEALLTEAFEGGVYGMSTGLEYLPGRYADADELNGLAKIVGAHDGIISSHIRSEDDDTVAKSVDEVITQGQYARVNVTHIKVVYGKTRAQGDAVLKQIRDARASGMHITADVYPYLASYGSMIYLYPEWAKRKSEFDEAVNTRRDEFEAFLKAKIKRRNGADAILISKGEYAGKTLQDVADILGKRPEQVIIDFGHSGPSTAHFIMTKNTQDAFITAPDVSISSDGSPTMRHPRSYGSFAKILEEYVVRDKLLSPELAVHKMSGLTAQTFGILSRGTLAPGMAADILVIDLANVKAGTGWSNIQAQPSGFDAVIVNGHVTDTTKQSGADVYGRMLLKTKGD